MREVWAGIACLRGRVHIFSGSQLLAWCAYHVLASRSHMYESLDGIRESTHNGT